MCFPRGRNVPALILIAPVSTATFSLTLKGRRARQTSRIHRCTSEHVFGAWQEPARSAPAQETGEETYSRIKGFCIPTLMSKSRPAFAGMPCPATLRYRLTMGLHQVLHASGENRRYTTFSSRTRAPFPGTVKECLILHHLTHPSHRWSIEDGPRARS